MKLTGLLSLACAAMLTVACNSNGRSDGTETTRWSVPLARLSIR